MPGRGARRKGTCKSDARKRADALAAARGRCKDAVTIHDGWISSRPPACVGENPFDARPAVDSGGAAEGQGVLKAETTAFDGHAPEDQLSVPAPASALDWSVAAPQMYCERGATRTIPRWSNAQAARALPAYHVAAAQQLLGIPRRALLKLGAAGVTKKLQPLCAAINGLVRGAYLHGLLTRQQICSTASVDVLCVLKVVGSRPSPPSLGSQQRQQRRRGDRQ